MIRKTPFVLAGVLILSFVGAADAKRAFEIADYFRTAFVGSPVVSPDGTRVVVPVKRYELATGTTWSELWIMAADGSGLRRLTEGRHDDKSKAPLAPFCEW